MQFADSRRLTGPSLLLNRPGVILEVTVQSGLDGLVGAWQEAARGLLHNLGWTDEVVTVRRFRGGASLAFTAPLDALYAATEVNEAALALAAASLPADEPRPDDLPDVSDRAATLDRLRTAIAEEQNPELVALLEAAKTHGVPVLRDDETLTLGLGTTAQSFPVTALPSPDDVDAGAYHTVPFALVTGTNGKSSTVRLLAAILRAAGCTPAITTTDYVQVGDEVVERGDFSGPEGARKALRDPRADSAVLEVARGGILRRGLPVVGARAAVVTNVAADHLGDYGIHSVEELAGVKFTVRKGLAPDGILICNADDPPSVRQVDDVRRFEASPPTIWWFSQDSTNPLFERHLADGGVACTVRDGVLGVLQPGGWLPFVAEDAIPVTMEGRARHMVANALAAAAAAHALGLAPEAIRDGLRALQPDLEGNPGRSNLLTYRGAQVLVDYAHNAHGMKALVGLATRMPARRKLLLFGTAGDRTDDDVRALARTAALLGADRYLLLDVPEHRRGRSAGELAALLREGLRTAGIADDRIGDVPDTLHGVQDALGWAQPGDLLLLVVLAQRPEVLDLLRRG